MSSADDGNDRVRPLDERPHPVDVISAGPRTVPARAAWLTAVLALIAVLIVAIAVAVHFRGDAASLGRQLASSRPARSSPAVLPPGTVLSSSTATLPPSGTLTGEVTVFAVRTSAGRAQVIVTAQISGGRPHASYDLAGSDCTGHGPDAVWAAGVTDGHGSADLTGSSREVVVSYEYFMVLDTPDLSENHPGPSVHGYFGTPHGLSAVLPTGIAPCAP